MVDEIKLIESSVEKTFVLDVKKEVINEREYLKELDARISNLESLFNITVERKIEVVK